MQSNSRERATREKHAYNEGNVFSESSKLQRKFWHVFESPNTKNAMAYFETTIHRNAANKTVLDYGCFDGGNIAKLKAADPKSIVGIDISEKGIMAAKSRFSDAAEFYVMDAQEMEFPDNTFDLIVGRSILHHLDFTKALKEIFRVLRPGGKAIFVEPLGDNPAAKFLRFCTPRARTADELPLSRHQIEMADALFTKHFHHFFNLTTVPLAMTTSLLKIPAENIVLKFSDRIDHLLANMRVKYWMRSVILVWEK